MKANTLVIDLTSILSLISGLRDEKNAKGKVEEGIKKNT